MEIALGIDGCQDGWTFICLENGAYDTAKFYQPLAEFSQELAAVPFGWNTLRYSSNLDCQLERDGRCRHPVDSVSTLGV